VLFYVLPDGSTPFALPSLDYSMLLSTTKLFV
jgi:hypothetical protein